MRETRMPYGHQTIAHCMQLDSRARSSERCIYTYARALIRRCGCWGRRLWC